MKVAIIQFPGSNCDWDSEHAVKDVLGISARRIWHKDPLPGETEAVIVPGGFSFGDYLRCGAIARFSPIMNDLKEFSEKAVSAISSYEESEVKNSLIELVSFNINRTR